MSIYTPQHDLQIQCNLFKISMTFFFYRNRKSILKFTYNFKGPQRAKSIFKKKKFVGLRLTDFKTYDKAAVIKQYG